jgi:RND family efflux transporter MFP subunit
MADPGAMLASGAPVLILVDDAVLEFRASVPSADFGKAQVGAPVQVSVDAQGGRTVEGRLARIVPLVEERTRSFEVVVEVPGQKDLVGGLFARATVRVGRVEGALVVPPAALIRDGSHPGEAETFVVTGGKAERRTVALGVEGPTAIQVLKGLEPGDQVVLDPPAALSSGAPVDVQAARK